MMNIQEIFERQHKSVYRIAMLMLNNQADAEDAVQNIFIKYYEKGIEFNDIEHEKAWFITVTRNYCIDLLRSYWKKNFDFGELPDMPVENEEKDGEVLEYIKKLPDKYREVIYLYYYEEYSVKEIANILERKESTIQTQLSAAREKLKKILMKEGKAYV